MGCLIIFSYGQRIPPSRLRKLQLSRIECGCCQLRDASRIGIAYATRNNLFGVNFHHVLLWKFGIPWMLTTDLEYRPRSMDNGYFGVELMRERSIRAGNVSLSLNAGYKRVLEQGVAVNHQFHVGSGFFERHYGITISYALWQRNLLETHTGYNHGILIQYYREFFDQLEIKASGIYWFDEFQYSIKMNETLFQSRLAVGIGFEKISRWNEFDITVSYYLW